MAKIYKGALELVGNTPLMEVVNVERELGLKARDACEIRIFKYQREA